jgi:glutathione peroxidase
MRYKTVIAGVIIIMGIFALLSEKFFSSAQQQVAGSLYDFTINSLDGTPIDFSRYRGENLLIVNNASKCGYTPQ